MDKSMDNEFLLQDRIQKIQQIINQYDEKNFYISYSGGMDSNVLSALVDMALPDNKIPRVYADTGIELNAVRDFVKAKTEVDDRFIMIKPKTPIKQTLEKVGYPFKSKFHSLMVDIYQRNGETKSIMKYLRHDPTVTTYFSSHCCPKILMYQFSDDFKLKISSKCCDELKKKPLDEYQKQNNKPYKILGIMPDEGGQRETAKCLAFSGKKLKAFQPLVPVTKEWERWFIEKYGVELPIIYYPPYNFERSGCKGCVLNINLQHDLDILEKYFPAERKQCERIWKPVYDEYRRLGYRLKKDDIDV